MAIHIADPDTEKIRKKLRWLRWKGDVLMREVRMAEKLQRFSRGKAHHGH